MCILVICETMEDQSPDIRCVSLSELFQHFGGMHLIVRSPVSMKSNTTSQVAELYEEDVTIGGHMEKMAGQ